MSENIKVDPQGAQAAYGPATAEVAGNRVVGGADGVRPGLSATLAGMSSTYNANVDGTTTLTGQGSQFANGFDTADKDGAAKAGAAGPKGPGDPAAAPGGDKFASRLTPNDLLKITRVSSEDDDWFHEPIYMPPAHDPSQDRAGPGPDSIGRGLAPVHPIANDPGIPAHSPAHIQMVSNEDDDDWFTAPVHIPPAFDPNAKAGPGPNAHGLPPIRRPI